MINSSKLLHKTLPNRPAPVKFIVLFLTLMVAAMNASADEGRIYSNEDLEKYHLDSDGGEDQVRARAEKECKEKILATGSVDFTPDQIVKVDIFAEVSSEEGRFEFLVSVIYHMNDRNIDTQHFLECTATKKNNGKWDVLVEETARRLD